MANNLTSWKLALMDYIAGSQCVFNPLASSFKNTERTMSLSDSSTHVNGRQYNRDLACANRITAKGSTSRPKSRNVQSISSLFHRGENSLFVFGQ